MFIRTRRNIRVNINTKGMEKNKSIKRTYNWILNLHLAYLSSAIRYDVDSSDFKNKIKPLEGINIDLIVALYDCDNKRVNHLINQMIESGYKIPDYANNS